MPRSHALGIRLLGAALLVLGAVLGTTIAPPRVRADARADIVELRHDRSPTRHQLLGWTAAGDAVFRWIVCSEGGERHCTAAVGAFGVGTASVVTTLDYQGYDRLAMPVAVAFIRAEREAIAALGPLTPPTGIELGRDAFGEVLGAPSDIRARLVAIPGEEPFSLVRIAVHAGSARAELGRMGTAQSIDGFAAVAYPSPDGTRLAIAAQLESTTMCWGFTDLAFRVLDVAEVRGRLGALP